MQRERESLRMYVCERHRAQIVVVVSEHDIESRSHDDKNAACFFYSFLLAAAPPIATITTNIFDQALASAVHF